jgi:hypothetical protein
MAVDSNSRLIDVRQIGPHGERDISGRCSACGVVLIARLDNWEDAKSQILRERLEKAFARHLAENRCGQESERLISKQTCPSEKSGG